MELTALLHRVAALPLAQRHQALRALVERGVDLRTLAPPRRAPEGPSPLSPQQEDLWTYEALYPGAALNLCGAYWFEESVDTGLLAATLDVLSSRHRLLRSRFVVAEAGLEQREGPHRLVLEHVDVGTDEKRLRLLIQEHARAPFDLGQGPPVRALLLTGEAAGHGVMVLAFHHIVTDWWTFDLLHGEMSAIYTALAADRSPQLPDAPDYAAFAAWHQDLRALDVWRDDETFWAAYLTDPPAPPFPATARSPRAERIDVDFGPEALEALTRFARETSHTVSTAAFSVFSFFLHQVTGVTDVIVGTPTANRDQPGTADLVGYVMNMVPVRVEIDPGDGLSTVASGISGSMVRALAHGRVPLGRITTVAGLARRKNQSPAYQVVFMYLPEQASITALPGKARFERVHTGDEENGFVVILRESGGHLTGTFEFRSDLVDVSTVRAWTRSFAHLLSVAPASPSTPLADLAPLPEGERRRLLALGTGPEVAIPEVDLPGMLAGHAPEALALVDGDQALTYGDLEERSARLAGYLREQGVGPGQRVGIHLGRSATQLVAVLAVLRTGAAYLPLDPDHPLARRRFAVEDTGAAAVLVADGAPDPRLGLPVFVADGLGSAEHAPLPSREGSPRAAAYVMHTSGSTGRPKGVEVSHRGAVNLATAQARAWGLGPGDRVLQFASLGFDASVEEIWTTWACGACLVLAPTPTATSISAFVRFVERSGVTVLDLPTAYWTTLATEPGVVLPPSVHTVVIGGESYPGAVLASWRERYPRLRLINTYGPTEATVTATSAVLVPTADRDAERQQVIGAPLDNVVVRVLDGDGRPVAAGVAGELYIGGAGVALGYVGRPELTAERFVERDGEYVYRTGDLARMRSDGSLVFLGRADDQVKVRGYRIEPGEVENVLAEHPEVAHAAVVVEGSGEAARLVAHLVCGGRKVPEGLWGWLSERLPGHMVPALFVPRDTLPTGPTGKVDREALRADAAAPAASPDSEGAGYAPPRDGLQRALTEVWAEVLGVDRVGVDDDFFALGGTSLLAIRAAGEFERRTGCRLPFAEVFALPTVASLATLALSPAGESLPPRGGAEGDWPLSAAQSGLWYLSHVEDSGHAYTITEALLLGPGLDPGRLEGCLTALTRRHEALRTTFVPTAAGPVQRVHSELKPGFRRMGGVAEAGLSEVLREETGRPFDLEHGPLVRLLCVRLADGRWALALSVHHIVADGHSVGVLMEELAALYTGNTPAPAPLQQADYAVWQRDRLGGEERTTALAAWTEQLRGAAEVLELPWDRPRPPRQGFEGATVRRRLPPALVKSAQEWAREQGITPFSVFLAAYRVLLTRLSGEIDYLVGLPVGGRTRTELERVVGFFVNTVPSRTRVPEGADFAEMCTRVGASVADALRHQEVPLEEVVSALRPRRDPSTHPLFQVVFSWDEPGEATDFGTGSAEAVTAEPDVAKFDLGLALRPEADGGLCASFEFRTALANRETVELWAEYYECLLEELLGSPEQPVDEARLLGPARHAEVLALGSGTVREVLVPTAHGIVAAAARHTPSAPALVVGDEELTYAELDGRANALAARLRAVGVGPGSVVGLWADRSVHMYVGLVAVLKAGGAYVPLDPEYPAARTGFVAADAGVSLVIGSAGTVAKIPSLSPDTAPDAAFGPTAEPLPEVGAKARAYIIHTSGSTGRPKGVAVAHGAVVNLAFALAERSRIGVGDRVLQFASLAFDASVFEVFSTWAAGACLVAIPADRRTGTALRDFLRRMAVTVALLPPTVVAGLDPDTSGLRTLISGGEPCPRWLVEKWGRGRRLINAYGPTEATVCATAADLAPGDEITVGLPIANVGIRVTDALGRVVPVGVVGELCVGGAGVAIGYHGLPELTEQRFVTRDGERLYRTGDRARIRADGRVELLGREDDQVKVNGFRIELGEVESAVAEHPDVLQAVASVFRGGASPRLIAYVRTVDGRVPEGLRGWLSERVPDHVVPALITPLNEVPLGASGKVDRSALPAPDTQRPELATAFVPPSGALEQALAALWCDVLQLSRVGTSDNFFELGGDSLRLVELTARAETEGLPVTLTSLYTHQTIGGLAEELRSMGVRDE